MAHNIELFKIKKEDLLNFRDFLYNLAIDHLQIQIRKGEIRKDEGRDKNWNTIMLINELVRYYHKMYYLKLRIYDYEDNFYLVSLRTKSHFYTNCYQAVKWDKYVKEFIRTQNYTTQDVIDEKYEYIVKWLENKIKKNDFLSLRVLNSHMILDYLIKSLDLENKNVVISDKEERNDNIGLKIDIEEYLYNPHEKVIQISKNNILIATIIPREDEIVVQTYPEKTIIKLKIGEK